MVTITCDMCGVKVHSATNRVDLSLEYDGIVSFGKCGFCNTHKQLCIDCTKKLVSWIDSQLKKDGE